jgi:hypothetical protein
VQLEGLGKLKNSDGLIGNRIRGLPVCRILPRVINITNTYFLLLSC